MLAFNLILQGLKFKIKISGIYFDEKCNLSTCGKIRDYNMLLSFSSYHQNNDSYPFSNLILYQIKKKLKK
jgi:hypothetical protein